jgi:hypothetical protein
MEPAGSGATWTGSPKGVFAGRKHHKPTLALNNNTAGVREREEANRTRVAGRLDEIQGVVVIMVNLFRNVVVGFIDWLGAFFHIAQSVLNLPVAPAVLFVE